MKRFLILFSALILTFFPLFCQQSDFELEKIQILNTRKDSAFKKYQDKIEKANIAYASGRFSDENMAFFSYTVSEEYDSFYSPLQTIAARCSVSQDSIITLNHIEESTQKLTGKNLILPVADGLYLSVNPQTRIEILLSEQYAEDIQNGKYPLFEISGEQFYFMQKEHFSPAERAYFFDSELILPLEKHILTSAFGMRKSPISGKWLMHNGIDMAAPLGSSIMACKSATVQSVHKLDPVYGNYIILDHGKDFSSLYAHMDEIFVNDGEQVKRGQIIGTVGLTGLTTGPHLHFEIHDGGSPKDPNQYF